MFKNIQKVTALANLIGLIHKQIKRKNMKSILTTLAIVVVGVILAGYIKEKVLKF